MSIQSFLDYVCYQAESFAAFSGRIAHGFTGKPLSVGGTHTEKNTPALIQANRDRLHEDLQRLTSETIAPLAIPEQVHGSEIGETGQASFSSTDAIVIIHRYAPALVLAADCVPIILYAPDKHMGAVVHAGWRGTAARIVQKTIEKLQTQYACDPALMRAVIGPAIGKSAYQVSRDVLEAVAPSVQMSPQAFVENYFADEDEHDLGKFWVNLKRTNAEQCTQVGVTQVEVISQCTMQNNSKLYSHRSGDDGRHCAYLMLL